MGAKLWKIEEVNKLIDLYAKTLDGKLDLTEVALSLNRTRASVSLKASRMGLANACRSKPRSSQSIFKFSTTPQERWSVFPHPRGMLGKKHTEEHRQKQSQWSKERWKKAKDNNSGVMSPESRKRRSIQISAMMRERFKSPHPNIYSRCKGGRRADIGSIYFRSAWEANYARYLNILKANGRIEGWKFEPDIFKFPNEVITFYIPDFKVFKDGAFHYVEIKGWMDERSKTKLKYMRRYYPKVKLIVIEEKQYREIESEYAPLISNWELKR